MFYLKIYTNWQGWNSKDIAIVWIWLQWYLIWNVCCVPLEEGGEGGVWSWFYCGNYVTLILWYDIGIYCLVYFLYAVYMHQTWFLIVIRCALKTRWSRSVYSIYTIWPLYYSIGRWSLFKSSPLLQQNGKIGSFDLVLTYVSSIGLVHWYSC